MDPTTALITGAAPADLATGTLAPVDPATGTLAPVGLATTGRAGLATTGRAGLATTGRAGLTTTATSTTISASDGRGESATVTLLTSRKFPLLGLVLSRYGLFELVFCPRRVVMCAHVLA
jgi:hypothetical protein